MKAPPVIPVANRHVSVRIGETVTVCSGDILVQPVDVDAHLNGVPKDIHLKGALANHSTQYVGATRPEAYSEYIRLYPEDFSVFHKVSARDALLRIYDAARLSHPDIPVAEALRCVGWSTYENFLGSLIGRMLFRALGKDLEAIYRFGPRAFAYAGNTVRVLYTRLGDRHVRYDYDPCFTWLDSYQLGVFEGAAAVCGYSTELTVHLTGAYHGSIECRWF